LTNKIKEAASLMEMRLVDHIIIAGTSYFSFADEGLL
jgi:DNA repair protein RadC